MTKRAKFVTKSYFVYFCHIKNCDENELIPEENAEILPEFPAYADDPGLFPFMRHFIRTGTPA